MFYIDSICPACEQGARGVYRCANRQVLVLMCDECQAVWPDLSHIGIDDAIFPTVNGEVDQLGCLLFDNSAGWATRDEIVRAGWDIASLKESRQ